MGGTGLRIEALQILEEAAAHEPRPDPIDDVGREGRAGFGVGDELSQLRAQDFQGIGLLAV